MATSGLLLLLGGGAAFTVGLWAMSLPKPKPDNSYGRGLRLAAPLQVVIGLIAVAAGLAMLTQITI